MMVHVVCLIYDIFHVPEEQSFPAVWMGGGRVVVNFLQGFVREWVVVVSHEKGAEWSEVQWIWMCLQIGVINTGYTHSAWWADGRVKAVHAVHFPQDCVFHVEEN